MSESQATYECKICGDTFTGDRWEPEWPDTYCCKEQYPDGHIWAEKHDSNV